MLIVGGIILLITIIAIIKNYDSRMILLASGILMCILAGKPFEAFKAFVLWAAHPSMVPIICTVIGFTYVTKMTKCDEDLVHLLSGLVTRAKHLLIPATMIVSFIVSLALPSAAGAAAAVGAVLIPLVTSAGIHPVIAASAVFAGTWGDVFSPGSSHNILIAKLAGTDVMTVIYGHAVAAIISLVVVIASIIVIAIWRKEYSGYESAISANIPTVKVHANVFKAILPIFPLLLIFLGSKQVGILPYIQVPEAMIYGTIAVLLVTRANPGEVTKQFFLGMGNGYTGIIGILIAAGVFSAGMTTIGLTQALIDVMKETQSIARLGGTFGPFIIGALSGSGIAGSMAFNTTITPHALDFGLGISEMGSTAFLTGGFGRSMSPVAAAAIVCAGFAGCNPIDIVKRTAPGMIIATFVTMIILLF